MTNDSLAFAAAWEVRDLISKKEISPVELTELFLRRIEALNPRLNAYLTVAAEEALAAARAAEKAVLSGGPQGALHGVPISVKDLELTKDAKEHSRLSPLQRPGARSRLGGGGAGAQRRSHHPWEDQYS